VKGARETCAHRGWVVLVFSTFVGEKNRIPASKNEEKETKPLERKGRPFLGVVTKEKNTDWF